MPSGFYNNDKANLLTSSTVSLRFLCGILNSKIFSWQFGNIGISMGEGFEYKIQFVNQIRIPPVTLISLPTISTIESLVDSILALKKDDPKANTDDLDREIDELVYGLYGLTEEEINIIKKK